MVTAPKVKGGHRETLFKYQVGEEELKCVMMTLLKILNPKMKYKVSNRKKISQKHEDTYNFRK